MGAAAAAAGMLSWTQDVSFLSTRKSGVYRSENCARLLNADKSGSIFVLKKHKLRENASEATGVSYNYEKINYNAIYELCSPSGLRLL